MLKISWVHEWVTSNWISTAVRSLRVFRPEERFSNDEHFLKFCYVVRYYPVLTPGKSNSVAAYTILRMTWLSTHQSQKSILRMA
nr:hypothetical protein [Escherichia coli]